MLEIYKEIVETLNKGGEAALATVVETEDSSPGKEAFKMLIFPDGRTLGTVGGGSMELLVTKKAREVMETKQPVLISFDLRPGSPENITGSICGGKAKIFIEPIGVGSRVLIFGAGHVGYALAQVAAAAGFKVTVIDDRAEYANAERFPTAERIIVQDMKQVAEEIPLNQSTYVVIVSRGHAMDKVVLKTLLLRDVRPKYIGMIGSRRKVQEVFRMLEEEGIPAEELKKVKAPIGLSIGAQTAGEIAVSIVAEMICEKYKDAPRSSTCMS